MSVVNKMLRDLESREPPRKNSADYIPPKLAINGWLIAFSVCLLAFIATSYSFYVAQQSAEENYKPQDKPEHELQAGEQYARAIPTIKALPVGKEAEVKLEQQVEVNQHLTIPADMQAKSILAKVGQNEPVKNDTPPKIVLQGTQQEQNAFVKVSPSDGAQSQLSSLRAMAHLASKESDDEKVIQLLNEILRIAPNELRTRKQLAAMLFSKERLTQAQKLLVDGLQIVPSDSSLRLMLARIHFKLGDQTQAFTVLAEHPYQALANDELISFRAALAERIGEYPRAEQDYQVLIQRNPTEAKWWLGLGVSQDKQRLSEQAIISYQQAQSLKQLPQKVDTFVEQRIQLLARRS